MGDVCCGAHFPSVQEWPQHLFSELLLEADEDLAVLILHRRQLSGLQNPLDAGVLGHEVSMTLLCLPLQLFLANTGTERKWWRSVALQAIQKRKAVVRGV